MPKSKPVASAAAAANISTVRSRSAEMSSGCGNPTGERLARFARKTGMLLMGCDQCCYQRAIADKLIEGIPIGCFPDLYKALSGVEVHQVITL